jgi:hypothetical protein
MKIVYQAENIIDAHLVRGALEAEGIVAFVSGHHLTGAAGELPCWGLVNVMVAEVDVDRALPFVRQIDEDLRERRAEDGGFVPDGFPA